LLRIHEYFFCIYCVKIVDSSLTGFVKESSLNNIINQIFCGHSPQLFVENMLPDAFAGCRPALCKRVILVYLRNSLGQAVLGDSKTAFDI
jgi:hypothetical protein